MEIAGLRHVPVCGHGPDWHSAVLYQAASGRLEPQMARFTPLFLLALASGFCHRPLLVGRFFIHQA
jgi:hypothetical protein